LCVFKNSSRTESSGPRLHEFSELAVFDPGSKTAAKNTDATATDNRSYPHSLLKRNSRKHATSKRTCQVCKHLSGAAIQRLGHVHIGHVHVQLVQLFAVLMKGGLLLCNSQHVESKM